MAKRINRSSTRKFSGAVIPVGSKTGKILLSSKDSVKIIAAVRKASTGEKVRVELSEKTVERVSAIAQ